MKTYIKYIIVSMVLPFIFSCQEAEPDAKPVEPIFPTLVKNDQVKPGEELEFKFTPNLDWELSLSEGSFQYFRLLDEYGREREKITGSASQDAITIKIWVNPLEEFDTNRSCILTLTMGSKSQAVAEYMRPAKNRALSVYAAKVKDGVFETDDAGAYVYESVEAQDVEILWSDADAAFILPIKVVSNCSWDINRNNFPSWLELNVPNQTEGTVELVLKGISLQAATGKISFVAGSLTKDINVSIASCSELSIYSAKYEQGDWVYVEGNYEYTAEPVQTLAMVWTGSDIRIPVMVDSKCEWTLEKPEWITAQLDDRRSGEDHFVLICNPQNYPLDDTEVTVSFKYAGQVIKTINLLIPGCRNMISYALGMSMATIEFNYSGQYKTTSGYMDAPLKGYVTAPSSMVLRTVEIVDGQYVETAPAWLNCELNVDADTDTKLVLQTKSLEISVAENLTPAERSAYIFLLPKQVESLAELFGTDKCTVADAYHSYAIPVVQASLPADYLTPESSETEMAAEGAYIAKSEKTELFECFGATRYVYEIKYENTWSSDVAKMYLTTPYVSVEFYDADKNLVTDKENFWITFTDYMENKTFGAITIPIGKMGSDGNWVEVVPQAGMSYVVFKDDKEATLCVVEFTYAPKEVEPEVPFDPEDGSGDLVVNAGHYFDDAKAAIEAGASFVEVTAVSVPKVTSDSTQEEIDLAAYKKSLKTTWGECRQYGATLYRLTYTKADTELTLDFTEILKDVARLFTVNPYMAQSFVTVDGMTMDEDGGHLIPYGSTELYHGKPTIKMKSFSSLSDEILKTQPIKILFYNSDSEILLGIECVLSE